MTEVNSTKESYHPFPSEQGAIVYRRTYSRTKPDGSRETWFDTTRRVAKGNLAFVYGNDESKWAPSVFLEYNRLIELMDDFSLLPAGRHLWATGVSKREFVSNCFASGWTEKLSDHFTFTLLRLAEGGGVGANYSTSDTGHYPSIKRNLTVHIVCDPSHPNYEDMVMAGLISSEYHHEWMGSYQVEDSREGWADAIADLLDTFVKEAPVNHQNRVYDVSRLRRKGAPLRTFGGVASGPEPFAAMLVNISKVINARFEQKLRSTDLMEIDHEIGACVVAGGNRRSARMSIVKWDDPEIFTFINCKKDPSKHWTTNISVEINDEFIHLLSAKVENPRIQLAKAVYRSAIIGMLTSGEPGFWNSSKTNLDEIQTVRTTNPCGEIGLVSWESCILGHVNLDNFVDRTSSELYEAHRLMTRFLVRATYGTMNDAKQAKVVGENRRIGVGHLGVQAYLAKLGVSLSELQDGDIFCYSLKSMYDAVRQEARDYAFQLRIPEPVKVTTVAPTGSVAKMPGTTEGIHPIYARHFERRIRFSTVDPKEIAQLDTLRQQGYAIETAVNEKDTLIAVIPTKDKLVAEVEARGINSNVVVSADEISLTDMMKLQAIYQEYFADNAVSFTANIPATDEQNAYFMENPWGTNPPAPSEDRIQKIMDDLQPWLSKIKGTTIMVDGTRPQAPYTRLTQGEFEALTGPVSIDDSNDENCAQGSCPVR